MFKSIFKLFSKEEVQESEGKTSIKAPEVMGLSLGGSFTMNELSLQLAQESLVIENANPHQIIQAVGVVEIDHDHRIIRYYTDDDGYLQFNMYGDEIQQISLWYIYEAKFIPESKWMGTLRHDIVKPNYQLEGFDYEKSFDEIEPVILTEKTYKTDSISETDQFSMLYVRQTNNEECKEEMLLVCGEEKLNSKTNELEHEFVTYTGFEVKPHQIINN